MREHQALRPDVLALRQAERLTEEIKQQENQAAEFVDELSDEALDRPAGELAMACHQTAMTAMVKT